MCVCVCGCCYCHCKANLARTVCGRCALYKTHSLLLLKIHLPSSSLSPPPPPVHSHSLTFLIAAQQFETSAESAKVKAKTFKDVRSFRTGVCLSSQTRHQLLTNSGQNKSYTADVRLVSLVPKQVTSFSRTLDRTKATLLTCS